VNSFDKPVNWSPPVRYSYSLVKTSSATDTNV